MENHEKIYRRRVTIFSIMMIVLAGISIALSVYINRNNTAFSNYVDVAGQQRMLSQRIALTATLTAHAKTPANFERYIRLSKHAIERLNDNHLYLGESIHSHTQLARQYDDYFNNSNEKGISRMEQVDAYITLARRYINSAETGGYTPSNLSQLNDNQYILADIALDILPIFQGNVAMFNAYIESETQKNFYIKTLSTLFFASLIGFVFLRIFTPFKKQLIENTNLLEREKEKSEREKERYLLATQGTSIGIWDLNIQTRIFYWSPLLNQILGLHTQNTQYHTDFFQNLLHPNDREIFNQAISKTIKNKDRLDQIARIMHANGEYIWARISGKAVMGVDNRVDRLIGSLEDITDKTEAQIQRDTFIQGIEQSGLAMALIDNQSVDKRFTYVTGALCEMLGHTADKLIRTNLNAFTGPETNMADLDAIDAAMMDGRSLNVKILSYRQDGSSFWNSLSLYPIQNINKDKTITHYVVVFKDLTEAIEQEQMEINRQRNESLGALAASVAHEINNLLMPMTMAKDILEPELKPDHDPFAMEQLDMMVEYANQARDIVGGILLFSRKETENLEITNIYEILKETIAFIRNLLRLETKIEFSFVEDDLKTINCMVNKTEFRQIIANLTKNAEDAFDGDDGQIDFSLSTATITNAQKKIHNVSSNDFVTIIVRDNGTGIPDSVIEKIFEPLFSTKPVGEGTGLGLSVVHGIIKSWGGFILVDSLKGEGTTFTLHIPVLQDSEDFSHLQDLIEIDDV